jgi:nucleoside-diphosphate-sugar epimerase
MKVLVTGAGGFIGASLVSHLTESAGAHVVAATRQVAGYPHARAHLHHVSSIGAATSWAGALTGVNAVVHCAARVPVLHESVADALGAYRAVNVEGTMALARQAAGHGVRRLVFLSSVKVNGEDTPPHQPFTADSLPAPQHPYAVSMMEAEQQLRALALDTGLEVVIVRPVLVYGPGVKGNFLALLKLISRGVPLPFGSIDNRRSLVGLDNLLDLLVRCLTHAAAANRTFLVSDGDDLSTPALVTRSAAALGVTVRLLRVPPAVLSTAARALGRHDAARRLVENLQVDITATRQLLGWIPPASVDEQLARTAAAFRNAQPA